METYINAILEYLLNNYVNIEWNRKEQEITGTIKNYNIRISPNRDGNVFIQFTPIGSYNSETASSTDYYKIKELRTKIWDHISNKTHINNWKKILMTITENNEN